MFDKILIANRGEIACRVIRSARRLGVRTVAVFSEADAAAPHVEMADEAYLIGPPAASESYLNAGRILEVASHAGAQALHPGYGFLSENAGFAEDCAAAGVIFIGPPAAAIRAMGQKHAAKALMAEAGVPVVPGYHGEDQNDEVLARAAEETGYPVLIKASAGGGGKGMRLVEDAGAFARELAGARREAKGAFGDERMLIERFVSRPRHIEVQVFGDAEGNVIHLFERDCSLQRRHQKVVEEAPAPGLPEDMRQAMGEAAVAAAAAIGYQNAGTVEFIVESGAGFDQAEFYFMEMNTRLQVEHPVTEMTCGLDLVEWQLRVAAGEPLPLSQDEIVSEGHAIEVRLYAENPRRRFLPSPGRLEWLQMPVEGPHVRVDAGVVQGDLVTPHYDPMIAKLVVWERNRSQALRRLRRTLADVHLAGVITNIEFLGRIAAHPAFAEGDFDTGFIDRHIDDLVPPPEPVPDRALALAALHMLLSREAEAAAAAAASQDPWSPFNRVNGWRLNDAGHDEFALIDGDREVTITVHFPPGAEGLYLLELPDGDVEVQGSLGEGGQLEARVAGARTTAGAWRSGNDITIVVEGTTYRLGFHDPLAAGDVEEDGGSTIAAPLPGRVVSLLVESGAEVDRGDALIVMDAMKMEHTLNAPMTGRIKGIHVAEGAQVEEGTLLLEFEVVEDEA
ncbi:MAG: acetyl/propionyl/methylcrotonyl-CoA carboxylase subunit alpha [Alphaproteobacteria bacterium]|jgi:3-methylcrotonyl-CoA carboxylase alpha subunit|nr:acetyl/propionyl/methylcrotonyl-CoA carboxylase subunit alpha [Alphaproteobacteria bacterium]MDP6624459.1 acetyl/propionyl/methylcrotonyl-CoA carboxylase subunit alpha [Alphaproteobacteria bacterium]